MTAIYRGKNHLFDGAGEDVVIRAGQGETLVIDLQYTSVLNHGTESSLDLGSTTRFTSIYPVHFDAIPHTNVNTYRGINSAIDDSYITTMSVTNITSTSTTATNFSTQALFITNMAINGTLTNSQTTIGNLTTTSLTTNNITGTLNSSSLFTCTNLTSTTANFSKNIVATSQSVYYAIGSGSAQTISSLAMPNNFSVSTNVGFTDSSFAITVPTTGFYILSASLDITSAANQYTYGFSKNTSSSINLVTKKSIEACKTGICELVNLNAGDIIRFLLEPSAGTVTIANTLSHLVIKKYF